jgi:hypothetical protein
MTINETAERLLDLLADAATDPLHEGYLRQADLMSALYIRSEHTLDDIVTVAAIMAPAVYPGSALVRNQIEGYRLRDRLSLSDMRQERGRLRSARTNILRAATCLSASRNGPTAHLAGLQLTAFNDTVMRPLLQTLDQFVVSENTA